MPVAKEAWPAIRLTIELAGATTVLLLLLATPLAWWLASTRSRWRLPVSALVTMPLVLPPSVLGFYLLVAMGPDRSANSRRRSASVCCRSPSPAS